MRIFTIIFITGLFAACSSDSAKKGEANKVEPETPVSKAPSIMDVMQAEERVSLFVFSPGAEDIPKSYPLTGIKIDKVDSVDLSSIGDHEDIFLSRRFFLSEVYDLLLLRSTTQANPVYAVLWNKSEDRITESQLVSYQSDSLRISSALIDRPETLYLKSRRQKANVDSSSLFSLRSYGFELMETRNTDTSLSLWRRLDSTENVLIRTVELE